MAFLDADVEVTQDWCNAYQRLLDADKVPENLITGAQCWVSKSPSWIEEYWFSPLRGLPKNYINGCNIIVTRALFDQISGFDEKLATGEDVDFCLRAQKVSDHFEIDPEFVVFHEGFPKDVRSFLSRERWHGKGDFEHLGFLLKSKTAILTVILLLIHVFLVLSLITLIVSGGAIGTLSSVVLVLVIVGVLMVTTCVRFKTFSVFLNPVVLGIQYLYFVGRGISAVDAAIKYLRA